MKLASILLALLLVCCMGVVPALAAESSSGQSITLPTTPPEVDDTPIEPAEQPQPVPDSSAPEIPAPTSVIPPPTSAAPTPPPPANTLDSILTTETVVLLGLVIWYALTLVGIVGGRRPRPRSGRAL